MKQGNEVYVLAPSREGPWEEELDGIKVIRVKKPPIQRFFLGLRLLREVKKRNIKPDIIHAMNPMPLGWLYPLMKQNTKTKCVLSLHTCYRSAPSLFSILVHRLAQAVDRVVVLTPVLRSELVHDGIEPGQIKVIPSGVDTKLFRACPEPDDDVIGYVGGFRKVKNIPLLLEAFATLHDQRPEVRLRMIGGSQEDGEYRSTLNKVSELGLRDFVEILPPLNHFLLPEVYRSMKLVVLTSTVEGMGKVLLEANASNRVVVAPRVGGIPTIIRDGYNGLLFDKGSMEDLVSKVLRVLDDDAERRKMARNGKNLAWRSFDWRITGHLYSNLFEELLQARRRLRIARFVSGFPHKEKIDRGLEPNYYYISREQVKQGNEVYVLAPSREGPWEEELDGIKVIRVKKPPIQRFLLGFKLLREVKRRNIKPDIIHAMNPVPLGWLYPFARSLVKSKCCYSIHASSKVADEPHHVGLSERVYLSEFRFLSKFLARSVDRVLPISRFMKRELVEQGISPNRISIVPSGVDCDMFRGRNGEKDPVFTILYVGRFVPNKGLRYLLDSTSHLNSDDLRILLVGGAKGDSDYEMTLQRSTLPPASEFVRVLEPIPHFQIPEWYQKSHVFVLPSVIEPLGKVLIEAMCSGTPIVSTRSTGIIDLVQDGKNGVLVNPGDARALAEALEYLKGNPKVARRLALRGEKHADDFDWSVVSRRYVEAFRNTLGYDTQGMSSKG